MVLGGPQFEVWAKNISNLSGTLVEHRIKAGLTFYKASALTPILSLKFLIFKKRLF